MWIICYVMMPYCHGRHTPLGLYYARESWECDTEPKGGNAKKNSTLPPRVNTIQNRQFRLRECYQNFTSPQAEILYLFRFMVPFAEMHIKIFIHPLAGIWSGIDNSACGDAIKILHSRERRFCNNFVEMHIKIYIPPSREYNPESTVPLAGMQSKFYIPVSGDFVFISVHGPCERRCT